MKVSDKPIVVEQEFQNPVEDVWKAIIDLGQMRQWFFENIPDFKPEVGFETQFKVEVEERVFTHLWKIVEVTPIKNITYNWKYAEYSGDSFVTFELFKEVDGTTLQLTTEVIKDFPDGIPEFSKDSCVQGWNYFIRERLKNHLEKS